MNKFLDWLEDRLVYSHLGSKGIYPLHNLGMNLWQSKFPKEERDYRKLFQKHCDFE